MKLPNTIQPNAGIFNCISRRIVFASRLIPKITNTRPRCKPQDIADQEIPRRTSERETTTSRRLRTSVIQLVRHFPRRTSARKRSSRRSTSGARSSKRRGKSKTLKRRVYKNKGKKNGKTSLLKRKIGQRIKTRKSANSKTKTSKKNRSKNRKRSLKKDVKRKSRTKCRSRAKAGKRQSSKRRRSKKHEEDEQRRSKIPECRTSISRENQRCFQKPAGIFTKSDTKVQDKLKDNPLNLEKVCRSIYAGLPGIPADDRQPVRNPNDPFLDKAKKKRKTDKKQKKSTNLSRLKKKINKSKNKKKRSAKRAKLSRNAPVIRKKPDRRLIKENNKGIQRLARQATKKSRAAQQKKRKMSQLSRNANNVYYHSRHHCQSPPIGQMDCVTCLVPKN